jgi:hypothetical protein
MGLFDESSGDEESGAAINIDPHVVNVNVDLLSQRTKALVDRCQQLARKVRFYVAKGNVALAVS